MSAVIPFTFLCFYVKRSYFPRRPIIHLNICALNSLSRWHNGARMGVLLQCIVRGPCRLDLFLWVGEEMSVCVCVRVCVLAQLTNWRNRWTPHSPCCEETQHLHIHTHTSEQHSTLNRICWHVYVRLFIHLIKNTQTTFVSERSLSDAL